MAVLSHLRLGFSLLRRISRSTVSVFALLFAVIGAVVPIYYLARIIGPETSSAMIVCGFFLSVAPLIFNLFLIVVWIVRSLGSFKSSLACLLFAFLFAEIFAVSIIDGIRSGDWNLSPIITLELGPVIFLVASGIFSLFMWSIEKSTTPAQTVSIGRGVFGVKRIIFVALVLLALFAGYKFERQSHDFDIARWSNSAIDLRDVYVRHRPGQYSTTMMILAENPALPADILDEMAKSGDSSLLSRVATNPNTPMPALDYLADHGDSYAKFALTSRTDLPERIKAKVESAAR